MASSVASTNITNREALRDKIHEIHNFLRNNGAGYGMNALKVFNIFYGLKKIEHDGWLDRVDLKRPYCEFSFLLKLANENQGERLAELFLRDVLDSIYKSRLKDFLFYEIPRNLKGSVFVQLIKEIESLVQIEETCNVLLSGKIYEYFIGRDRTAISELGAYFTDRHIVDYILNKVNPSITADGTIPTMVDMFGGSGGFTTGYINFLKEKYPRTIDWSTQLSKVHHYDMNEDVIKSAALEFFCLTGVLPDMSNMCYKNSFVDEFSNRKFKLVLTNPPYGGDKASKTDSQLKQDKVKEYIKQTLPSLMDEEVIAQRQKQLREIEQQEKLQKAAATKAKVTLGSCSARIQRFAHLQELTGNDKESCSLMLMMDIIDAGGTAVGVLKEGVFFDRKYKDLRKCLLENFNVREVISVPQDQFENTSTKTSIIVFDNAVDKTTEVIFRDLIVEKYADDAFGIDGNNRVVLVENRGDIRGLMDRVVSVASREEILSNSGCSLNAKDYSKKPVSIDQLSTLVNPQICNLEEYDDIELGAISDITIGSTPDTKNPSYWDNGNIPWATVTELNNTVIYKTNKCITQAGADSIKGRLVPRGSIMLSINLTIGKLGIAGVDMFCNQAIVFLNSNKIPAISQSYLYYLLATTDLEQFGRGSIGSSGNLSREILTKIKLKVPKSPAKIQEWVAHISEPLDEKNAKQLRIDQLETLVKTNIRDMPDFDEVELGAISDITLGSTPDTKNASFWDNGNIPWASVCDLNNNVITKTTKYITQAGADKIGKRLIHKGCILLSFNLTIGKLGIAGVDMYCNQQIAGFNSNKIPGISQLYLYYSLATTDLKQYGRGSLGSTGSLNKEILSKIKLKIPRDKHFLEELEKTFQEISTLKSDVVKANELYQQRLDELAQETNPTHKRKRTTFP